MSKSHVLDEIRRITQENRGISLGVRRFHTEAGIRQADWGKYWIRWGDALREAGFSPLAFQQKILSDKQLLEKLIALIRELGRYPVRGELRMKHRNDAAFPDGKIFFNRFGRKHALAARLVEHCRAGGGYQDVLAICQPLAVQSMETSDPTPLHSSEQVGYVYF